jgi:hypothetical protein
MSEKPILSLSLTLFKHPLRDQEKSTMEGSKKQKDVWDKIASATPLILGLAVTGVGVLFTQIYNFRQLQLNQIEALEKLRPLLISEKAEEREFGYATFTVLGYEEIAIRIIRLRQDESGRSVLTELKRTGSPQIQADASSALSILDKARKLVNIGEFGNLDAEDFQSNPELRAIATQGETWSLATAQELGISSKLGIAILYDTAVAHGVAGAERFQEAASRVISPPLDTREKERGWLNEYLDQRDKALQQRLPQSIYLATKIRIDRLRNLIRDNDWELRTIASLSIPDEDNTPTTSNCQP